MVRRNKNIRISEPQTERGVLKKRFPCLSCRIAGKDHRDASALNKGDNAQTVDVSEKRRWMVKVLNAHAAPGSRKVWTRVPFHHGDGGLDAGPHAVLSL